MSDDFFDDFEDDFDGELGDYEDSEPAEETDDSSDPWEITWDGLQWQDWMIIGPLSEEIAREEREKDRIRKENERDEDDYWIRLRGGSERLNPKP
jgi:hypothetical protein